MRPSLRPALAAALVVCAAAVPVGASAQGPDPVRKAAPPFEEGGRTLVRASDPEGIVDAIRAIGYRARLDTDATGDPLVLSVVDRSEYRIEFYGCTGGKDCQYLRFSMGFDLPDGIDFERVNLWNRDNIVGTAFLDEDDDPYLELFVTTAGGISQENFADVVDWWEIAVREFKQHIGFSAGPGVLRPPAGDRQGREERRI